MCDTNPLERLFSAKGFETFANFSEFGGNNSCPFQQLHREAHSAGQYFLEDYERSALQMNDAARQLRHADRALQIIDALHDHYYRYR